MKSQEIPDLARLGYEVGSFAESWCKRGWLAVVLLIGVVAVIV